MPETYPPDKLAEQVEKFKLDPLGFVFWAYPWGEPGELEHEDGPDNNQVEFLRSLRNEIQTRNFNGIDPVMPVRMAEASGHGTGKSAMGAWLCNWIMSTRPFSMGTVTAGTAQQLESRTWSAIQRWTRLCITKDWFDVYQTSVKVKHAPEAWKVDAQTCKEENAQSFAGQHAKNSTSWYLFDEASAVPERVWEVAMGGLSDGEPMIFAWGQMERNTGRFYDICFGREAHLWNHRSVDSRSSRFTNKQLIDQQIATYGADSDFCRVRIFGLPPRASEHQFIDWLRIEEAQKRAVEFLPDEPLICGVDVSGGGLAWNVARFRRGLDARSIPPSKLPGEAARDRSVLVGWLSEILRGKHNGRQVDMMFIDAAFGAAVAERLSTLGYGPRVMEVNFGAPSRDKLYANQRAQMWAATKDWLQRGAIDDDPKLKQTLALPGFKLRSQNNALVIQSKQDLEVPLDDADALALTFAYPVAPVIPEDRPQEWWSNGLGGGGFGSSGSDRGFMR